MRCQHAKQQTPQQLRKQARHKTEKLPLLGACEFCGATEHLEHCHLDYKNYPELYLTGCKQCHEWADKKNPDTKQLAYENKLAKMWRYLNKHKNAGYEIQSVTDHTAKDRNKFKFFRIIEPQTKIIKEVLYEPTF
jgi:transcription elongation factor Elf1